MCAARPVIFFDKDMMENTQVAYTKLTLFFVVGELP
jgi:hypothetical protein